MSSSSNNRYQSRLFNLIRKQSRLFTDLFSLRVRQLKVTTSWSLEATLYPIYKLWQTTVDLSARQLPSHRSKNHSHSSKLKKNSSTPNPPSADMAVLGVKKVVEEFKLEIIQHGKSEFVDSAIINNAATIPVRGIASRISESISGMSVDRQLVLVTSKNEILDILTLQQQQKLQEAIITEVANYSEAWRLSEIDKPQPFLLTISRFFKQLTSGKSKTKSLNNLSPDVSPKSIKQAVNVNDYRVPLAPSKTLFAFDTAISRIESNNLVPVSQATLALQKHSSQIILSMKNQFGIFNRREKVHNQIQQPISTNLEETQFYPFQGLIQGALNYFFGQRNQSQVDQLETTNSYTPSLPESIKQDRVKKVDENSKTPQIDRDNLNKRNLNSRNQYQEKLSQNNLNDENRSDIKENASSCAKKGDNWLELHDIFSESPKVQDPESVASFLMPQTEIQEPKNFFQKITSIFQGEEYSDPKRQYWIAKPKPADTEKDFTQTELEADPTPRKNKKDAPSAFTTVDNGRRSKTDTHTKGSLENLSLNEPLRIVNTVDEDISSGQIVHQPSEPSSTWEMGDEPDYFETEGKFVGYEKHPLERILNCLDNALLKLEDIFARIVSLIQMLLRNL